MNRTGRKLLLCAMGFAILLLLGPNCGTRADGGEDAEQPRDEILSAQVGYVAEEREIEVMDHSQTYQKLELIVTWGARRGEVIIVEHGLHPSAIQIRYKAGDRVYLTESQGMDGRPAYFIVGLDRSSKLLWMFLPFVALVVLVGRKRGARSMLGMALSFGIIFAFILPRISRGEAPVVVALLGTGLAMPLSYYLSHGLNRKTTVALVGSLIGLVVTGVLAVVYVEVARLTGFASDEAGFLQAMRPGEIDIKGLLLAGMVIGVLGVLDDVTVAQAGVVTQLRTANPSLEWRQLYSRAMQVGQDHIASMVNTLVLVYAGAALPLLLLLSDRSLPLAYVLSHEVVAEEIVRALVTSIGLVAAVPITTLLASWAMGLLPQGEESTDPHDGQPKADTT